MERRAFSSSLADSSWRDCWSGSRRKEEDAEEEEEEEEAVVVWVRDWFISSLALATSDGPRFRPVLRFSSSYEGAGGRCPLRARFRLGRPRVKLLMGGPPSKASGCWVASAAGVHPCKRLRACEDEERAREWSARFWWFADLVFIT